MSKSTIIFERIAALERHFKKSGNQLGKAAGIGNGTVGGWNDNLIGSPSLAVEKFLQYYKVNPQWWKTGEGEMFSTSVQKEPAVTEFSDAAVYRRIVEGGTEYLLVPRTAFEGHYRFIPIEEIEMHARELERKEAELIRKDSQIQGLHELFKMIASGLTLDLAKIQEAKKNAGV